MKIINSVVIILSLIAIAVIGFIVITENTSDNNPEIPIESEFENKIVYTTDLGSVDKDVLENDCQQLGGVFNECGSACSDDAEACASVCAYTCDLN